MGDADGVQEYVVSSSGRMSLPAAARHRWHLDRGGPVDVLDLGFGVLTVPNGERRRLLGDLLSRDEHAAFVRSLADDRSRHPVTPVLLDDHLLRDVLADDVGGPLADLLAAHQPATTNLYYVRLCQSAVSAPGGRLTGSWSTERRRALGRTLLALPDHIEVLPMRTLAYRMAELADVHPSPPSGRRQSPPPNTSRRRCACGPATTDPPSGPPQPSWPSPTTR